MIGTQKFVGPLEFMECDDCGTMPGIPDLCAGCVHNRAAIAALTRGLISDLQTPAARLGLAETSAGERVTR